MHNNDNPTLEEILAVLGEPTRIEGDELLYQCEDCHDSGRDNLKYNKRKQLLSCMSDKLHRTDYKKIMDYRKKINTYKEVKRDKNPVSITKEQIDLFNKRLNKYPSAVDFLYKKRKIYKEIADIYGIGVCDGKEVNARVGSNWVIPIYNINGNLAGAEFRRIDFSFYTNAKQKAYKCFKTVGISDMLCCINPKIKASNAIITEGFFDGIVMMQWLKENNKDNEYNIYTASNGAGCITRVISEILDNRFKKIYLCLDKDKSDIGKNSTKGVEAQNAIIANNPHQEFYIINFNCDCCKDFNDYYMKHNVSFDIIQNAKIENKKNEKFLPIFQIYENKVLDEYCNPEKYPSIKSGYPSIDCKMDKGGFANDDIIAILSRPSMGKTSLIVSMMMNNIEAGYKVGLASLEVSASSIIKKVQSRYLMKSNKDIANIFKSNKNKGLEIVSQFRNDIKNMPLYISDESNLSLGAIKSDIMNQFGKNGVDILYIDHMNLVQPNNKDLRAKSIFDRSTEVYNNLIPMSKELGIPIVAACQLNRACEARQDKRPQLSDISNSGAGEAVFSVAMGIYRQYYYDKSMIEFINEGEIGICKNRNGECGIVPVKFFGQYSLFREPDEKEKNNIPKSNKIKKYNDDWLNSLEKDDDFNLDIE